MTRKNKTIDRIGRSKKKGINDALTPLFSTTTILILKQPALFLSKLL